MIEQIAQAILDLINSQPRSPTKDELVALLAAYGMARAETPTSRETEEADAASNVVMEVLPPAPDLPFVSDHPERHARGLHGTGRCFWDVKSSGVWCEDCELGAEYGRLYLEHLRRTGKPDPLMCWIVADMIAAGRWSGVECGFVQTVFERR
jgi:hypothetical protein